MAKYLAMVKSVFGFLTQLKIIKFILILEKQCILIIKKYFYDVEVYNYIYFINLFISVLMFFVIGHSVYSYSITCPNNVSISNFNNT